MGKRGLSPETVLTRRLGLIMCGSFAGLVLSKGIVLLPGFAIDDYVSMSGPGAGSDFFISQGRFTFVALTTVLEMLDLSVMQLIWPAAILLLVAAAFTTALGLDYTTRGTGSVWMLAAIGAVVGAYPYFTEYFAFRSALVATSASYVLLAAALVVLSLAGSGEPSTRVRSASTLSIGLMVILLVAATGLIQLSFVVFGSFVLGRVALDVATRPAELQVREALVRNKPGLLAVVVAAPIYLVAVLLTQRLANVEMAERGKLIQLSAAPERSRIVLDLVATILFRDEAVLSRYVKFVLLSALVLLGLSVARESWRRAILALLLATVLVSASVFTVAVGQTWWPVPRSMYPLGFAFGVVGAVMIAWLSRTLLLPLTLLVAGAIGCAGHSSAILADQLRLNRWDQNSAETLGRQLLATEGVTPDTPVVLVGPPYSYPVGLDTAFGDVNVSALAVPWGADALLEEATGYEWTVTIGSAAEHACPPDRIWPNPESITTSENLVLVCMSPSP